MTMHASFDVAGAFRSVLQHLTTALGIDIPSAQLDGMVELVFGSEDLKMYMSAAAVMADFTQPIGQDGSRA